LHVKDINSSKSEQNEDEWGKLDSAAAGLDPVVGFCDHSNEPLGSIKKAGYCLTSQVTISFSKNLLFHGVN
jgi:hypothetical protein